jgi:hypothetical protein
MRISTCHTTKQRRGWCRAALVAKRTTGSSTPSRTRVTRARQCRRWRIPGRRRSVPRRDSALRSRGHARNDRRRSSQGPTARRSRHSSQVGTSGATVEALALRRERSCTMPGSSLAVGGPTVRGIDLCATRNRRPAAHCLLRFGSSLDEELSSRRQASSPPGSVGVQPIAGEVLPGRNRCRAPSSVPRRKSA